nr:ABC transporter ATP-binding protein [Microbispora sp. H10836]
MGGIVEALRMTWRAGRLHTGVFVVFTVLGAVAPVAVAWLTKLLLDGVTARGGAGAVLGPGVALAAAGLVMALVPHVLRYTSAETGRRVGLLAQERLFAVTERFVGMARFEDPAFLNRLRMALQHGGTTPGVVVAGALSTAGAVVTGLGFLGSLLVFSPWMPVLVLATAAPVLGVELRLARRRAGLHWRLTPVERREIFFRDLLTDAQAAKEIRLFGIGAHLRERMSVQRRRADGENRRQDRRELHAQGLTSLLGAAVAGGATIWAVLAAAGGRVTVGDVSLLVAAVAGVQAAGLAIVDGIARSHQQLLLFTHFREVLYAGPDLPVPASPREAAPLARGIEFRDVWFRYSPGHPWTLRGLNLTIPHGRTVGVVGRNGAGKSTLVKLLCRMYDPERGAILWDGVDLRDLDPAELRSRISAVFQDYMEYDLTAAENIGLGDLACLGDRGWCGASPPAASGGRTSSWPTSPGSWRSARRPSGRAGSLSLPGRAMWSSGSPRCRATPSPTRSPVRRGRPPCPGGLRPARRQRRPQHGLPALRLRPRHRPRREGGPRSPRAGTGRPEALRAGAGVMRKGRGGKDLPAALVVRSCLLGPLEDGLRLGDDGAPDGVVVPAEHGDVESVQLGRRVEAEPAAEHGRGAPPGRDRPGHVAAQVAGAHEVRPAGLPEGGVAQHLQDLGDEIGRAAQAQAGLHQALPHRQVQLGEGGEPRPQQLRGGAVLSDRPLPQIEGPAERLLGRAGLPGAQPGEALHGEPPEHDRVHLLGHGEQPVAALAAASPESDQAVAQPQGRQAGTQPGDVQSQVLAGRAGRVLPQVSHQLLHRHRASLFEQQRGEQPPHRGRSDGQGRVVVADLNTSQQAEEHVVAFLGHSILRPQGGPEHRAAGWEGPGWPLSGDPQEGLRRRRRGRGFAFSRPTANASLPARPR